MRKINYAKISSMEVHAALYINNRKNQQFLKIKFKKKIMFFPEKICTKSVFIKYHLTFFSLITN